MTIARKTALHRQIPSYCEFATDRFQMTRIMDPDPGMSVYDACFCSGGLLVKRKIVHDERRATAGKKVSIQAINDEGEA